MLAQPSPLPEKLILASPEVFVDNALSQWGSSPSSFEPEVRKAYVKSLEDPDHVTSICEEYRAAASIDRVDEDISLASGNKISCPTMVIWSKDDGKDKWYQNAGGPLVLWSQWAKLIRGKSMSGGHFFPEQESELTTKAIQRFILEDFSL